MNYNPNHLFEWDIAKSKRCLEERGFDFMYAAQVFFDPFRCVSPDLRFEYGEERYITVGRIQKHVFLVVYTHRGRVIRIISARRASQRECVVYENSTSSH
ncbi:MAG: BrnT family toxin [Pseudohongiella sp.]|nr:BrnT family toxin [Pseudohongiella sp.]